MNGNNPIDYRMHLYIQIQDIILKKIESGEYFAGMRIPSERELAQTYGVSRVTVKKAIEGLVEKGLLCRRQGKGTFVNELSSRKLDMSEEEKIRDTGFTSLMSYLGSQAGNKVLFSQFIEDDKYVAEKLGIKNGDKVFALGRVRYEKDNPVMVQYAYVPFAMFPDIEQYDFSKLSLYKYMESKGHLPVKFNVNLNLQACGEKEARLLGIPEGKVIYFYSNSSVDAAKNIVEYTEEFLNPDVIVVSQYVKYRKINSGR